MDSREPGRELVVVALETCLLSARVVSPSKKIPLQSDFLDTPEAGIVPVAVKPLPE
jgi:hypothetical protein